MLDRSTLQQDRQIRSLSERIHAQPRRISSKLDHLQGHEPEELQGDVAEEHLLQRHAQREDGRPQPTYHSRPGKKGVFNHDHENKQIYNKKIKMLPLHLLTKMFFLIRRLF